jgi:ubiquinone/menaquinone biosynthesis C-methylase UbiE
MRKDWDRRARKNARYFVVTDRTDWTDEEFFRSGEQAVREHVLEDMGNICQGRDPKSMRVLEIGCGAGRVTRALAALFGEVHAVDISGEMVRRAREVLACCPNAHVYQNNGYDLSVLPDLVFDFAFSTIVFQHIPSVAVIESYLREVHRVLRPGALFRCEVQGAATEPAELDTWVGVTIAPEEAQRLADATGFDLRYQYGAHSPNYWLWLFKRAPDQPSDQSRAG